MADYEGLYDDLDEAFVQPLEKDREKQRLDEVAKAAAEKKLTEQVNSLLGQVVEMTAKNKNLEDNITYLLNTSREELKR